MFWYDFIIGKKEHFLDVRCLEDELLCVSGKLLPKFNFCGHKLINNSTHFLNTKNCFSNFKEQNKVQSVSLQFIVSSLNYIDFPTYCFCCIFHSLFSLFIKGWEKCFSFCPICQKKKYSSILSKVC